MYGTCGDLAYDDGEWRNHSSSPGSSTLLPFKINTDRPDGRPEARITGDQKSLLELNPNLLALEQHSSSIVEIGFPRPHRENYMPADIYIFLVLRTK
jgi:hypothetical protein